MTAQSYALALLNIIMANISLSITDSYFSLYCCLVPQSTGRKRELYRLFLQSKHYQKHSKLQLPLILTQMVQLISAVQLKYIL